jgi:4-amino-4-deoxy-L-arabinose transferase-like glycosyltransferase
MTVTTRRDDDTAPPKLVDESPSRSRFARGLVAVCALAALIRFLNVFWWRPTTNMPGFHGYKLGGDAFYYHWQANALAKGAWFVDPYVWHFLGGRERPSATHPPLYVTFLALWSRLGLDSVTWHRVASCFLGIAAVAVIGLVGRKLGGNAVGLIAAGIAAVYPEIWINDGMLLSESMAILMTAVMLYTVYQFARQPTMRNAVLMGLVCGITALSRTELTLVFPLVVIPLALLARSVPFRERCKQAAAACVVGGLVLAPWILFNLVRFEEPTTMTSATGAALSAASCDGVYYGKYIGYYANCFQGPWPKPSLDESQRDLVPRQQAVDYIKSHTKRLPIVVAARIGRLWGVFKPGQTTALDWWLEGRGRAPTWIGLFCYYALMPFAIFGLVVMRRRRIPILPLLAIAAIATFAAALTFGVTRYRAPAEVALVLAAAMGAVAAWDRVRHRAPSIEPAP